ncbi:transcriptional regulator, AlpA family [Flavobacteriaceae bacterium MAR_2010_188]|nr:transcriptional regulator, AlpA family [Flavobacteriaceae bacterium MAR_2010_188]
MSDIHFNQTQQDVQYLKKIVKQFEPLLERLYTEANAFNNAVELPIPIDELTTITGLTKPTHYALVQKGALPFHKKRGRLYFFPSEIVAWIKSDRRTEEIDPSDYLK